MSRVVETMTGINDSSKKIAEIIRVIDGIGFQTNILALNAAVEAARAGEHGRGFAVLAEISAASAEQSTGIDQVGKAVSQMDQSTQRNTALIEECAAASETLSQQARQLVEAVAAFKTVRSDLTHSNPALSFSA